MHLERATWTAVDATETDLALLPIGSTEQHGPHAPLGTDTLNAETVADAAAERYDDPVVVAPSVPVGIAEEHRQFTGTLWTSESTFKAYVRDIVGSLSHHGFDRVVLVNGHGGNTAALRDVAGQISRHDDAYAVPFTWFDEVGDHSSRMGHGGPLETALLQHAVPDAVDDDRLEEAAENGSDRWGDWQGRVNLAFDSAEFTENGVVGDPREASAALGEELLELAADALVDLLSTVADRDLERPDHR
ncbi:creatininase family protein [Natronolimnohabitans sp. A-GB9]|uniref:creatininase family protein n=1 Tax=Natronolimnohabitans sp. A-GB9 TaxID=3069757 RepID=UPI0027B5E2D0|nr:creatininase family protein [Natronolimnohabitans sp. A-GB9]MDQ2052673.1 creatininase family protein [Natronolimnohabitans sp. A-GB9]